MLFISPKLFSILNFVGYFCNMVTVVDISTAAVQGDKCLVVEHAQQPGKPNHIY